MTISSEMSLAGSGAGSDWVDDERVPIFICGMPKSGADVRKCFKKIGWEFNPANDSLYKALSSLTKDENGSLLSRCQLLQQYAGSSWAELRYGRDQYDGMV